MSWSLHHWNELSFEGRWKGENSVREIFKFNDLRVYDRGWKTQLFYFSSFSLFAVLSLPLLRVEFSLMEEIQETNATCAPFCATLCGRSLNRIPLNIFYRTDNTRAAHKTLLSLMFLFSSLSLCLSFSCSYKKSVLFSASSPNKLRFFASTSLGKILHLHFEERNLLFYLRCLKLWKLASGSEFL